MKKKKEVIPKNLLQTGMTLNDRRYRIDVLIGDNGLTVTYKGYDTFRNKIVLIRELFPQAIMQRNIDKDYMIECKKLSDEALFLSMKEHLIKKARKLIKLYPVEGLANVLNFIEEHDTVYIIEEYIEGITLSMFFQKRHSVKFTVDDIMKYMSPVMDTLSKLHSAGIYHGAVYPENIRLLPGNKPVLLGVMNPIEDVAADNLNDPLIRKDEYTPVELYLPEANRGPAMDIYEVAAIFYNYVTGQPLPAYFERINEAKETFHPADTMSRIPKFQSDALMKALAVYDFDRFQTMDEFKKTLYSDAIQNDSLYIDESTVKNLRKKPFWYAYEQKQLRIYRAILITIILGGLIILVPRFYDESQEMKINHFYSKFNKATLYQQCEMLAKMDAKDREFYTNDYKDLDSSLTDEERSKMIKVKYYDFTISKYIPNNKVDLKRPGYEYMKIDLHENNARITYMSETESKNLVTNLKKNKDGSYEVQQTKTDEDGNSNYEIVYAKP